MHRVIMSLLLVFIVPFALPAAARCDILKYDYMSITTSPDSSPPGTIAGFFTVDETAVQDGMLRGSDIRPDFIFTVSRPFPPITFTSANATFDPRFFLVVNPSDGFPLDDSRPLRVGIPGDELILAGNTRGLYIRNGAPIEIVETGQWQVTRIAPAIPEPTSIVLSVAAITCGLAYRMGKSIRDRNY
jgi:hypothetical protein